MTNNSDIDIIYISSDDDETNFEEYSEQIRQSRRILRRRNIIESDEEQFIGSPNYRNNSNNTQTSHRRNILESDNESLPDLNLDISINSISNANNSQINLSNKLPIKLQTKQPEKTESNTEEEGKCNICLLKLDLQTYNQHFDQCQTNYKNSYQNLNYYSWKFLT